MDARSGRASVAVRRPSRSVEEREGPQLDALARWNVERRGRILEGGVRREAGAPVLLRIEALDQDRLVGRELGVEVPLVRRAESHAVGLADAMRVDQVGRHQLLGPYRAGVAQRQR